MKIIQDIFSLIMKFRLQLVNAEWQHDPSTGLLTHSNFQGMVASYKVFREYSIFLFKGDCYSPSDLYLAHTSAKRDKFSSF